jgi:hypothetical protein
MENLRQVVLGVSFFKQDAKGKSFVIAFDTLDEVHEFVAQRFIAQTWSGRNVLRQPTIVLPPNHAGPFRWLAAPHQ